MAENSDSEQDFINTARMVIYIGHIEDVTGRRELAALIHSIEGYSVLEDRGFVRFVKSSWRQGSWRQVVDADDPESSRIAIQYLFEDLAREMKSMLRQKDVCAFRSLPDENILKSLAKSGISAINAIRRFPGRTIQLSTQRSEL